MKLVELHGSTLNGAVMRERYDYDEVPAADVLRALDPTEHNMERLNRMGHGAGAVYQTARVRGAADRAAIEAATRALTRHAAVRARIVRAPDGQLAFAEGDAPPALVWTDDPAWIEPDMNAGPMASHRGSAFRVIVCEGEDDHAITIAAPHHLWDGVSAVALMRELLAQIAQPQAFPRVPLRAVESPFVARASDDHRARLRALEASPDRTQLEALESELLETAALPAELLDVQRLLVASERARPGIQYLVADEDPGPPPDRARRVSTGMFTDVIGAEIVAPLQLAARQRGLTMHAVFGGAALVAHVERHWRLVGMPAEPQVFAIASPVNLRKHFQPPLAEDDLRMAVDVALAYVSVGPEDGFWDVAARLGAGVTRDVARQQSLGSWFRTERRAMDVPLGGVPIPLVSNVGRVDLPDDVLSLHACMPTHGMFQTGMLIQTLRGRAHISYDHELPTVSRASMRQLAVTVRRTLERAAGGA